MMFWYGHSLTTWGWVAMSVGMLLFWGLLVAAIVGLARGGTDRPPAPQPPGPERLLAERFARGEIDEPEYRDRLAALHGDPRPVVPS